MPEDEYPDVPDSRFMVLDEAAEALCMSNTSELTTREQANIDLLLAELLNALWSRAEEVAADTEVPGKVSDQHLEKVIAGYRQARTLAEYLKGVM